MYTTFDTIAVTNDKDALTYEGSVYDFTKDILHHISEEQGAFNFYCQMLIGDYIDGVRGVDRIGKKTAPKKLSGLTPNEMHQVVRELYDNDARFILNYNLLRMWSKQWELYDGTTVKQLNSYEEFMSALTELKEELATTEEQDDEGWDG
jgi:5'-3' exonuclease